MIPNFKKGQLLRKKWKKLGMEWEMGRNCGNWEKTYGGNWDRKEGKIRKKLGMLLS